MWSEFTIIVWGDRKKWVAVLECVFFPRKERFCDLYWWFDITGLKYWSFWLTILISCFISGIVATG